MIFRFDITSYRIIYLQNTQAPDAPKRFKSAYICYVMENMDKFKEGTSNDVKVNYFLGFILSRC